MRRNGAFGVLVISLITMSAAPSDAGILRRNCCAPPSCGVPVGVAYCNIGGHYETRTLEQTVLVPHRSHEVRTVKVTEFRPEPRQRTITVRKQVPYTESKTEEFVVMVQKTEIRQVTHMVCRPVVEQVEQSYTVMVPQQETRKGVRHTAVCRPETVTATVFVDRGHWEDRLVSVPCIQPRRWCPCGWCGRCASCVPLFTTQCIRTWVPNIVGEKVTRTVMRPEVIEQPYEFTVTVYKPELQKRLVSVTKMVSEQVTKEVPYTVCVPEKRTRNVEVTKCRTVEEPKTITETVMVPVQVEKKITVPVCTMVPKTVQQCIRVWVPNAPACVGSASVSRPAAVAPAAAPAPAPAPAPKVEKKPAPVKSTGTAL